MNEILVVIKTPVTSLLSVLIIYILYLQVGKQTYIGNWIKTNLANIAIIFLLVILSTLLVFNYSNLLPLHIVNAFIKEFVISVMIGLPLAILWIISSTTVQNLVLSVQLKRLSLIEQLDLKGDAWMALEQDIISEEEAERAKALRSLRKWIVQENEIGWYEIREQIASKPIDTQANWYVSRELSVVRREKIASSAINSDSDYEGKLEALIPEEPVGEIWQKLDDGLVSEAEANEAQELYAFKKWAWKNDDTGWFTLQQIREDRGALTSKVVKFAKFELWEINKKKKKNDKFDTLREKKLKELIFA